ncbi:MAG: hypothetical protein ACRCX8_20415 [Sarcina sp.]
MVLDISFFLFVLLLCWTRYKGYCGACEGSKIGDIFQILVTGGAVILFVGVVPTIKVLIILALTSVVRYAFINRHGTKEEKPKYKKKGKSGCCDDNFI